MNWIYLRTSYDFCSRCASGREEEKEVQRQIPGWDTKVSRFSSGIIGKVCQVRHIKMATSFKGWKIIVCAIYQGIK